MDKYVTPYFKSKFKKIATFSTIRYFSTKWATKKQNSKYCSFY